MPPQPGPLSEQLERWLAAGLLSHEQAQAIANFEAAHFAGAQQATAQQPIPAPKGKFSAALTLSVIGALVLGLGIIALVAANWGTLPQGLKLAGLVLLNLLAYAAGYALRDRPGASWPGTGAALYLLGGVLFGALLGFLAQGLQLGVDLSTLLTLWGAGLLALAYGVRLSAALHLAVPLGAVIPLAGVWGGGWIFAATPQLSSLFIVLVGLVALALAWWHDHRWPTPDKALGRALGSPWAFWGVPLTLYRLGQMLFSSAHWNQDTYFLNALPLLLVAAALYLWGQRQERRAMQNWALIGLSLSLYSLCFGLGKLLPALLGAALALGLALWGGKVGDRRLVNIGLVGVGIAVLSVYFSLFMRLLSISLVLVGAGLLLLALGYALERARRRLNTPPAGEA